MKNVLSIAGSDPSGGAGIQADIKTMCAMGVYGMTAITAVTAQNTQAVYAVHEIPPAIVTGQIEAVFNDIRVDAVKIGMVSSEEIIHAIHDSLRRFDARNIVVDPVMVSTSGCGLLKRDAVKSLGRIIAIADVVTPNLPEAELLCGFPIKDDDDMRRAAENIAASGAKNVLIKGGHRDGATVRDLLFSGGNFISLEAERVATRNTHGTGCTLSSAIASRLALGDNAEEAARAAKEYITQAIRDAIPVGKGAGPVGHMTALYGSAGMKGAL